jgi:L-asparagine transporter-like permease
MGRRRIGGTHVKWPVGQFGDSSWFALIKVCAILAFIAIGIALIVGGPAPAVGVSNLFDGPGGFCLTDGRAWLALTLVITSMGVEVVAITAGEAEHLRRRSRRR